MILWFVRLQLSDYEVMFHESLDVAWLDKVDRRYAWLRRTLVNYEEECLSIFPPDWGIPERVCVEFCNNTRYKQLCVLCSLSGGPIVHGMDVSYHCCIHLFLYRQSCKRIFLCF